MSRQPKLCPKSHIPGYPNAFCDLAALASLSQSDTRSGSGEEKPEQRLFRVKRKHVLKACDRCRVKKTKCDGKQPCNRCSAHNHPCLFRERKATQTKVYSRGFVEMLESHHSLVVKALQKLYKLSLNKEGFPGEPLPEASDGYPLTHAILDRLGLIKQAEENPEDSNEDSEDLQYLRLLSTSAECSATTDPSPEPATPPEPSSSNCSPVDLSPVGTGWKWNFPSIQTVRSEHYHSYLNQDFAGLPPSRTDDLAGDTACLSTAATVLGHNHPYLYYLDTCNADAKESLGSCVTAGPGFQQPATATEMSVNMLGGFNVHLQEQQPIHPPLVPDWSYPHD
ncbi:hypothetical protein KXW21_005134 [Aspergillus fumigatus]|nr:hypothetical protein KXW21_005134 [Aspergillus fumigatus]